MISAEAIWIWLFFIQWAVAGCCCYICLKDDWAKIDSDKAFGMFVLTFFLWPFVTIWKAIQ